MEKTVTMQVNQIRELILKTRPDPDTKGHAFEVTFIKKNGEQRTMRARLGMRRNLTGKGMSYDPAEFNLIGVWEVGCEQYRMVNLETLVSLKLPDGNKHLVEVLGKSNIVPFA